MSFTNLTSGTNTQAAMVVGTGASLNYSGSGTINASTLNSISSNGFTRSFGTQTFSSSTTTAAFISELSSKGLLGYGTSTAKGSWSYAGNSDISDTGFGAFELAGTSIQTWNDGSTRTVLAIRPTTGAGGGQVLIYNDQGSGYAPGWRQIWTDTTDGSGSGLDADLLDGQSSAFYQNAGNLNAGTLPDARLTGTYTGLTSLTSDYYRITAGTGYGVCFWTDCSNYKIHMGNAAENHYGFVTDYSIKTNMSNTSGRGWTWGINGGTPVASIEVQTGNMMLQGDSVVDAYESHISRYTSSTSYQGHLSWDHVQLGNNGPNYIVAGGGGGTGAGGSLKFVVNNTNELSGLYADSNKTGEVALSIASNGTADFNNNAITSINWSASDDGSGSGLDADLLDGQHLSSIMNFHSGSDFANGTLVTTNIPASATNGDSFVIEISGKSYSSTNAPFKVIAQGYLYSNSIINYTGLSYGGDFSSYIKIFEEGGVLKFWWPRISYWNSFSVNVRAAGGSSLNRVTAIGNSTEPTGTKKVQVNLQNAWNSANDGNGSGLDADLLDAMNQTSGATANTIVSRNGNADFSGRYINSSYFNTSHTQATANSDTIFYSSTDNYIRKNTAAGMRASLGIGAGGAGDIWVDITGDDMTGPLNINGGTANGANDGTLYVTATNNNDWGLVINKYNGSATEYGQDIRVASGATYALRILGTGAEKFRVNGAGNVYAQGSIAGTTIDTGYGAKEIGDSVGNCAATDVHKGDGGCEAESSLTVAESSRLLSLGNYVWSAATTAVNYPNGITTSFVQAANGFPSYGTVINARGYTGGGGGIQFYAPYGSGYGGTQLRYRLADYSAGSGDPPWTGWKTVWDDTSDGSGSGLDADSVDGQHFAWSNSSNSPTYLWAANTNGSAFLAARGSISVNYANSSGNADTVDSLHASAFIRDASAGDWEIVSSSNSSSYGSASLEVRELNLGGAQTGALSEAPHLSFHWGGRVASQIFLETNGDISVRDNPGTSYEGLRAREYWINGTGRNLGAVTGSYGTVQANGSGAGGWEGFNIDGRAVFMHNGSSAAGLYNDVNDQWMVYSTFGAATDMRYGGTAKITTTSAGVSVAGETYMTGNNFINKDAPTIYMQDTNELTSMIHQNSNIFYILRGCSANSTSWCQYDSAWPLEINMTNNQFQVGGKLVASRHGVRTYYCDQCNTELDNNGDITVRRDASWNSQICYRTVQGRRCNTADTAADFSEYMPTYNKNDLSDYGAILNLDQNGKVVESTGVGPYIGARSLGGTQMNNDFDSTSALSNQYVLVGMLGQLPILVSGENGKIKKGDKITVSSKFAGYGVSLNKAGYFVGIAQEEFDPQTRTSCKDVASKDEIKWNTPGEYTWQYNNASECYRLPDGTKLGIITLYINPGFFAGEYLAEGGYTLNGSGGSYTVKSIVKNSTVTEVAALSEATIAKLTTGKTTTGELQVNTSAIVANLSVQNLTVANKTLDNYILGVTAGLSAKVDQNNDYLTTLDQKISLVENFGDVTELTANVLDLQTLLAQVDARTSNGTVTNNITSTQQYEVGDVLSYKDLDTSGTQTYQKATTETPLMFAGVIQYSNSDPAVSASFVNNMTNYGKAIVKVTTKTGIVTKGDLVTISTEPGFADKYTDQSFILGVALEDASYQTVILPDPSDSSSAYSIGTVKVNINPQNILAGNQSATASVGELTGLSVIADTLEINYASSNFYGNVNITGDTTATNISATNQVSTGLVTISGSDSSINALATNLKIQNKPGAGDIEIFGAKVLITSDGSISLVSTIKAKEFAVDTSDITNPTLGSAQILAGQTEVFIPTTAVNLNSKIFVTPTQTSITSPLIVSSKDTGLGFVVKVNIASPSDILFDWFIVQQIASN